MTYPNMPFFFGKVLGKDTFTISSSATAMFQPRDIMVVLDYSASMNDDSTFASIGKLSRSVVESSLQNCWNDLGPPTYGNLGFTPGGPWLRGSRPTRTGKSAHHRRIPEYVGLCDLHVGFDQRQVNVQPWSHTDHHDRRHHRHFSRQWRQRRPRSQKPPSKRAATAANSLISRRTRASSRHLDSTRLSIPMRAAVGTVT